MKPPLAYFGAKVTIAEEIVATFPEHYAYIEPYAGSLAVLLAKPQERMEVVNDLSEDLVTFWRVLRDRTEELIHVCQLTPHSRFEMEQAKDRDIPRRVRTRPSSVGAPHPGENRNVTKDGVAYLP